MSDLLNEIIQDVQADRMTQVWNRHGKWVIYAAISIVIVTAFMVYWKHYTRENAMRQTALYFEATDLMAKGNAAAAIKSLDQMTIPPKSSYFGLVMLKKAEAQKMLGRDKEAESLLHELASRRDVYGDIGRMMTHSPISDVPKKSSVLSFTRSEWAAWDLVAKGDNAKAAEAFTALAKMDDAPASERERALTIANYLKNQKGDAP